MTATLDLNQRIWFSSTQAAQYAGRHPKTVVNALRDGTLKGHQRATGCSWRIHRDDLDAWIRGESA